VAPKEATDRVESEVDERERRLADEGDKEFWVSDLVREEASANDEDAVG
jgi:hypothetical protein